jgi:prophage antirepressor-like protein
MQTEKSLKQVAFRFNASSQELTSILVDKEPYFVAKDICNILELDNVTNALSKLDTDEKLTLKILRSGQNRNVNCVSESGLYALIMRSNKPEAKSFRKWVTKEVLPSIRKKGFYSVNKELKDFIDARDVPFYHTLVNDFKVRCIEIENEVWVSINDCNKAIHSSTGANQLSKRLNAKQTLAQKIWLFGNTHPSWFTNELGLQLLLAGSRKYNHQLNLPL